MSAEDDVRQASARFYAALNRMLAGNADALGEVWAHTTEVTTMHPVGGREVGWDQVGPTWAQLAQLCSGGQVRLQDSLLRVVGDLAYETGTEAGQATIAGEQISFGQRVTNVYRREGGQWQIVHHHTDVMPAMVDLIRRVQGGQPS